MNHPPWSLPRWIAHRGAGHLAPENTLAGFRMGASHGYRAFECDVKLSADGVPFLLHDSTLERTTDGHGPAIAQSWSALQALDAGGWHGRSWAGEPLPALAAIARWIRRNGFALNLEIKPSPDHEQTTGAAVGTACRALWASDTPAGLVLSSFRPEALLGAKASAPGIPRALLLDTLWDGWHEVARMLGVSAIVCQHGLMDEPLRQRLGSDGWRALCYTVNDPSEARRLIRLGIDGIITDAVDRFSPVDDDVHD